MVSLVMDELWKGLRVIAGLRTNWKGLLSTEGNGKQEKAPSEETRIQPQQKLKQLQ